MLFDPSKSDATVHPSVLKVLSAAEIEAFRGVADDLASGKIKKRMFCMATPTNECGTACCIGGHVSERMGRPTYVGNMSMWWDLQNRSDDLSLLLGGHNPDNPKRASRAILHYLETGIGKWPE